MKKRFLPLSILILTFICNLSNAQIFVNDDATGADDGSSWPNAYNDLQDALATAVEGDEIWVAEGTYLPGNDPTATFLIDIDLKLYGGFVGTETLLAERGNPADHPTILSGDLEGDDILDDFVMNREDNAMTIVRVLSNVTNETVVNGFTISNGHADGPNNNLESRGAGIHSLGSPIIQLCSFLQNYAFRAGGGIHQNQGPSPGIKIEDCHFENNRAGNGAGLYIWNASFEVSSCVFQKNITFDGEFQANGGGASISQSSGTVRECLFKENEAFDFWGGLGFWFPPNSNNLNVSVSKCDFESNTSTFGGGGLGFAAFGNSGSFSIDSCNFILNTAMSNSALGVDLRGPNTEFTLTNSRFSENQTTMYYSTINVYSFDAGSGTATIDNCVFENNHSVFAAGLDIGSLEAGDDYDYYITNCIFRNNEAEVSGGGLDIFAVEGSTADFFIENCTIEGNIAGERAAGFWVDVASFDFQATMKNCQILGNQSPYGSGIDVFQFDIGTPPYPFPENAIFQMENCLIAENISEFGVITIDSFPNVRFLNCTVVNNSEGGITIEDESGLTLQNTILYNNGTTEFEELTDDNTVTSNGGNLIGDNSLINYALPYDLQNTNPLLDADYYPIAPNSPAIDKGIDLGNLSEFDLDGNPRLNGCVDIGAFESAVTVSTECLTNAQEVMVGEINLSPNPATDFIQLQLPEHITQPTDISLFDAQGRLVVQRAFSAGQSLSVGHLPSGFYTLKLIDGDQIYIGRLVKQ